MRIVAGRYGGRRLTAPAGSATRPTSDRVREATFQRLGPLDDARVLDLFAGSGALALEGLSRGAAHATLVDSAPAAIKAI
ncbi:MAG TPA: RsmD family RNA methyltransferase, partial [Conexibacter sp.]